ncbi:hypothetical protein HAX54_051600 [Datura stramonium]|uniref:Uncharacterized protein n=1 Tax=Datura stramonium TaxID=4076 RepID=A0ABS8WMM6_DATST|nr:hypothetical protein [Datura stramonium]
MARVLCPALQLLWTSLDTDVLSLMSCSGKLVEEEKKALLELRDSLNYPNGSALINEWIEETHLLTHFTHLQSLYVSGNAIVAGSCQKELDLSFNPLNGDALPHFQVCSLTSLEQLHLSGFILVPFATAQSFCRLCRISKVGSGDNFLDDGESIPACLFEKNSVLESLDVSHSNIRVLLVSFQESVNSGTCSNLTLLETLRLSDNRFDGLILFASFANLSNLEAIDLTNNEFEVDTETPSWVPSFQLVSLDLRNTRLNQNYGHVIPTFISKQHKLKSLSLSYNALQGNVPSWLLYNNTLLMLSLRGNRLYGGISASSQFQASSLLMLDVSDNCLGNTLPTNVLESFPDLLYLNLSNNALEGTLPSFDNLLKLEVLDLSDNFLLGKLPPTLIQNNTSLAHLVLSSNNFHGEVMPQFSNMSNLAYLHLQNDGFTGVLPAVAMFNLPVLKVMDISGNYLSGNVPDYFPVFPHLTILLLARNRFHGIIPASLCQMQKLHILDMSANLLSGVLPSCLSNITAWMKESAVVLHAFMWLSPTYTNYRVKVPLTTKGNSLSYEGIPLSQMTSLDLSMNRFTSEIPSQLGELAALHSLNVSHNILSGHIPESFMNLKKLESLDLSYNHLTGKIPPQMSQLDSLSTLNLAFNHLSGRIPFENKFVTFAASSYRGNKELCGPPLENDCVFSSPPQQHEEEVEEEEEEEEEEEQGIDESDFFFFSCIAVAYVVGFWSVIAPLLLSTNWRRTYYAKVDSCIELCKEKFHLL